jgi:uncharacterized delta-60 repeat protein
VKRALVAVFLVALGVCPSSAAASRTVGDLATDAQGRITVLLPTVRSSKPVILRFTPAGFLDPSFSEDGVLRPPLAGARAKMAVRPSGAIVVGGNRGKEVVLLRFHPDGNADRRFGGHGSAFVTRAGPIEAVLAQPDGHLIALGTSACLQRSCGYIYRNLEVRRYAPGGRLVHAYRLSKEDWRLDAAAMDPSGGFVVAGAIGEYREGTYNRFRPNGAYDGEFSVEVESLTEPRASGLAVDAQGRLVIAPDFPRLESPGPEIWRRQPDGSVDASFGAGGRAVCDAVLGMPESPGRRFTALGETPEGNLVATGGPHECWLVRYLADGAPDPAFGGGDGKVGTDERMPLPQALALPPGGGVLLAAWDRGTATLRLLRYRADGTPDLDFGVEGMAAVPVSAD